MTQSAAPNAPEWPPIEAVSDLVLIAGRLPPKTVVIPGGDREDDLRLVESARDHGIVDRCILVGDENATRRAAEAVGISVAKEDIIGTSSQEETAIRTVECVLQGGVDIILKGNISTPVLNRAMMRITTRDTMSLVTMFDAKPIAGGRPMLLSDPGVTTVCNFSRMVGIIDNAIDVAHAIMGIACPRVAVLSANEKMIDSLPSTRMGQALSEHEWDNAIVYGPLSFDLAVSEESVRLKEGGLKGAAVEVCGKADILICPCLDSANILYKVIMEIGKYGLGTFAGVTVGVAVPYVILSRADNVETKLQSIALSSIAGERMDMGRRKVPARRISRPTLPRTCRVLVVKPEAGATRVAVYENEQCLKAGEVATAPAGPHGASAADEAGRRTAAVREFLKRENVGEVDTIVAGAGLLPGAEGGLSGGTWTVAEVRHGDVAVDETFVRAVTSTSGVARSADLGVAMAAALAHQFKVPTYAITPPATDNFPRNAAGGAAETGDLFNVWAAALKTSERMGLPPKRTHYVVAHLGTEFTVAAIRNGVIVDSGVVAADPDADPNALVYRLSKAIGAMCVGAGPDTEGIILTGELTRFDAVARAVRGRVAHLFPVTFVKQSSEMEVLAQAACRALCGEETPRRFSASQPS